MQQLAQTLGGYLRQQKGTERIDDATLQALGVTRKTVRARLLQRLAAVGPLWYRGQSSGSSDSVADKGGFEDVRHDRRRGGPVEDDEEEDGADHYGDDFEGPTDSEDVYSSSLSPVAGRSAGSATAHASRRLGHSPPRPEVLIPRGGGGLPGVTSPSGGSTPPSPVPSSMGNSLSSGGTRTTRSTPVASPPHHMDSRGTTPATSPANPRGRVAGVSPSSTRAGTASAASRRTAEALSARLKEEARQVRVDRSHA